MAYKAIDVAKYIISYCNELHRPISNLKLQKMMYFAWIKYYNTQKSYLFNDEICAWQLGPVVPEVYYEFCQYAGIPITRSFNVSIAESDKTFLNGMIDEYLPLSASTLVNRSHRQGKPWDSIYKNGSGLREVIPFSLIIQMECDR